MVNGEGGESPPILLDLPAICSKCNRLIAVFDEELCSECFVEDEPDLDLVFKDG
jgi:hypothetical protein